MIVNGKNELKTKSLKNLSQNTLFQNIALLFLFYVISFNQKQEKTILILKLICFHRKWSTFNSSTTLPPLPQCNLDLSLEEEEEAYCEYFYPQGHCSSLCLQCTQSLELSLFFRSQPDFYYNLAITNNQIPQCELLGNFCSLSGPCLGSNRLNKYTPFFLEDFSETLKYINMCYRLFKRVK